MCNCDSSIKYSVPNTSILSLINLGVISFKLKLTVMTKLNCGKGPYILISLPPCFYTLNKFLSYLSSFLSVFYL